MLMKLKRKKILMKQRKRELRKKKNHDKMKRTAAKSLNVLAPVMTNLSNCVETV